MKKKLWTISLLLLLVSACGRPDLSADNLAGLLTAPVTNVTMEAKTGNVTFHRVKVDQGVIYHWFSSGGKQTEYYQTKENDRHYVYREDNTGHWHKQDVTDTQQTPDGLILFSGALSGADFTQQDTDTFTLSPEKALLFYDYLLRESFPDLTVSQNQVTVTAKTEKGRLAHLLVHLNTAQGQMDVDIVFSAWDKTKIVLPGAQDQSASSLDTVARALRADMHNVTVTAALDNQPYHTLYLQDGRTQSIAYQGSSRTETITNREDGKPVIYEKQPDGSWEKNAVPEDSPALSTPFALLPQNSITGNDISPVGFDQFALTNPQSRTYLYDLLAQKACGGATLTEDQLTVIAAMSNDRLSTLTIKTPDHTVVYTFTDWDNTTVSLPKLTP